MWRPDSYEDLSEALDEMEGFLPAQVTFYLSDDVVIDWSKPFNCSEEGGKLCSDPVSHHAQIELQWLMERAWNPLWWEYVRLRRTRQKKLAVLMAHGLVDGKDWHYWDDGEERPVQEWIDEVDGKYACLFIVSCNPGRMTPTTRRSMLVVGDENISTSGRRRSIEHHFHLSLIDPQRGEVDAYTIESRLEELRRKKGG